MPIFSSDAWLCTIQKKSSKYYPQWEIYKSKDLLFEPDWHLSLKFYIPYTEMSIDAKFKDFLIGACLNNSESILLDLVSHVSD